jgi:DNA repair exonuclease SbcCD ATPase subunit
MTKIKFEKVRVRNFLSFGPDPIEFEYKSGLNFVTGFNKDYNTFNGVGKTSLLVESISFALFGETYRDISQSGIINEKVKDQCVVELWFAVNDQPYRVVRSLKPNQLHLYKGEADISQTIPETTKNIINILGISKSIFNNTLVMTNNQKHNFLGQGKDLKTKFIEGILSLEVFGKMLDQAKKDYNSHVSKVDKSQTVIEELKKSVINDERYKREFDEKNANEIIRLQQAKSVLRNTSPIDRNQEIRDLFNKSNDILETDIPPLREKVRKAENKRSELYLIESQLKKELDGLNDIKLVCPTCKRPMGDHNPDEIEKEKTELKEKIKQNKELLQKFINGISKVEKQIEELEQQRKSISRKIVEYTEEQKKFDSVQNQIQELDNKIESIQNAINPFEQKIGEQTSRLSILRQEHQELEKEMKIKDAIKFVTSGQGVKSTIVRKILDTLNNRLAYYLAKLNSPHTCKFNEFFEEEILNSQGKEISYGNASGGEAKRIDFALLFAFRDIRRLQSGVEVNLSIFDEIFDSSICENCMSDVIDLLSEMAVQNKECFYVITHRPNNIPQDANVIKLEKEGGITKLIDLV